MANMIVSKKTICMPVKGEKWKTQASYMLPKPTVHEAMWVGKNSCESQWVSVGSGKRWVIMEMSKSDEENKIWSQSDYCIFHYVGGSIQGKWSIGRVEGA